MGYLDSIDPNHDGYQRRAFAEEREVRSGPTEDDDRKVHPYINICPDESVTEHGSPLNFGNDAQRSAGHYFRENEKRWRREERDREQRLAARTSLLGPR